jgi:methylenetetrahydrofolate reductase (NADPH)
VDAGADSAITQYFYNADAYYRFVDDCEAMGIDIPIVPGIMPILNLGQVSRMAELSGREIPDEVRARVEVHRDDPAALRAEGIVMAAELCGQLLDGGAPGLHFYTLNRSTATLEIYQGLGLGVPA